MAESNERNHNDQKDESEELKHVCMFENDDDDDIFHSLESESNADDKVQEKPKSHDDIIPSGEASSDGEFRKESQVSVQVLTSSSNADCILDNQCIDESMASHTKVKQVVQNSNISVSDMTEIERSCEYVDVLSCLENTSEDASCFSNSDLPSTKIIYRRNVQKKQPSGDSQYSCATANERSVERSTSCTDECPLHSEEIVKYVCMSCNKLACQACCNIVHKHCPASEHIPSLIRKPDFHFEERCKSFEEDLHQVQNRLKLNKGKAHSNLRVSEFMKINAKAQFKKQRDDLNRIFDCMEQDFNRRISEIESNGMEKIKVLLTKQEKIENELQKNVQDYNQRKEDGNLSRIFTKIEMSKEIIDDMKTDLSSLEEENKVDRYVFTPSKDVLDFERNILDLGRIQTINSETKSKITDVKTIGMKTKMDYSACQLSGLTLLSRRHLLAVDFANSAIKVVDIFNDTDVISVHVTPAPFDVSVIDKTQGITHDADLVNGQIVLTLPKEHTLRFMDYTLPSTFTAKRDVLANGMCRAVLYNDDRLFVTFPNQGKIEILDLDGNLFKRVTTETIGRLFQPLSITMDKTEGKIFVSDKDNHAVFCMNTDGDVIAIFNDHDLIEPRGLCVNMTGAVFVCSFATHKLYHLSSDCQLISTMKVADVDCPAPFPFSITYSDENNEIYVGQFAKNCIKVYSLEEVTSS